MCKFEVSFFIYFNFFLFTIATGLQSTANDNLVTTKAHPRVCGNVRITLFELKRGLDVAALKSCEIILGSITYAPMHALSNLSTTHSPGIEFPVLREVYGYILLGYSLERSFNSMFPSLSIIHGQSLIHGYSLIIMDNYRLEDIGLKNLMSIRRGNVIIARNAQLCYSTTIRWSLILETKNAQFISKQNKENCAFCPTCASGCWSSEDCQRSCPTHCKGNCATDNQCCPDQCVGGCYHLAEKNKATFICNACRNKTIHATGVCVEQCPKGMIKLGDSLCIQNSECISFFNGNGRVINETNECVAACPAGFTQASGAHCIRCFPTPKNNYCDNSCKEKHIRSVEDFNSLKYCSRVHTLNIYNIATGDSNENVFAAASSAFRELTQIDQEFTIHNVKVFSTLAVFSRLERIGLSSNATITIEENELLTELWPQSSKIPIIKGNLNIVRNARLCPKHITSVINSSLKFEKDLQITQNTWNEYANGYLASCESSFLTVSIDRIKSTRARITATVPQYMLRSGGKTDHLSRPFISIYYKPTKTRNESHVDAALSQKWSRVVEKASYSPEAHIGIFKMSAEITALLGDETYAVYASLASSGNTMGLYSPIEYFRTLPRQPEPIINLYGHALSSSKVELTWQPPTKPNGPIVTYLVYYAVTEERIPTNNMNILCMMKDRWHSDVNLQSVAGLNTNKSMNCVPPNSRLNSLTRNEYELYGDIENMVNDDQVVQDLSILEHQLINSVSHRKDPVLIGQDVKQTIIEDLDQYFEDKSSSSQDSQKDESDEIPIVEHKPHITDFNRTVSVTRIIIDGLQEAQTYMFQVYACHDITNMTLHEACSINGITYTIRTKASNASRDLVEGVDIAVPIEHSDYTLPQGNALNYRITWRKPVHSNGLIYFYWVSIVQDSHNGLKDERCVGNDRFFINVTLQPRTTYRLRITTYTAARLSNDFVMNESTQDGLSNSTHKHLFYEEVFETKDVPNDQYYSQNRLILICLILGSILLMLIIILGAPFYYYKYGRGDNKASISKNPNYELYTPDQWEIEKDSVTLERLIGQGHFGQVFHGSLRLPDGTTRPCAIKVRTTHPTDLLQEASIMKQFQCYHVIQLYGICSRIRPPYVVMELMENGDLKNYLQRHRQSEINPKGVTLTEAAMIQLALDVADGMYYLSDQRFVHRDLAARNCLVNGNHTCKVGDFGLTRDIYETDYYRRGGPNFLPIRWMAPESLRDGRFDTVSDVWSFGVLLWEIATLAEQPYQGYGNEEVVHYVRYGNITLERPQNCPEILHKLMRACWTYSPADRTSFRAIVEELVPFQNEDFRLNAYFHTQPARVQPSVSNESNNSNSEEDRLIEDEDDNELGHHHHRHD